MKGPGRDSAYVSGHFRGAQTALLTRHISVCGWCVTDCVNISSIIIYSSHNANKIITIVTALYSFSQSITHTHIYDVLRKTACTRRKWSDIETESRASLFITNVCIYLFYK